ncbi:MAG: di-trans,poly-cis-decaprenylcistransferase [Gammaproteobacteria bacterium]|jgi:undecaprenyl diphosphate synthase|nr:di-trans,poly-cis-decaprenylcistransferase [Gammaproteobacteria bacterium]
MVIPKHIAIIMDGNGRWAKKKSLPLALGHQQGVKTVREIVKYCGKIGVEYLTLFAFSSENANRSKEEVSSLSKLFFLTLQNEEKKLMKHNVSLEIIGDLSIFSNEIQNKAQKVTQNLSQNTGLKLIIAANYGGRWELFDAAKKFATDCIKNNLTPEHTQESAFSEKLATSNHPEVDLLIRTSGEQRLSNFLLWNIAYAELFFSEVLWPDFKPEDIDKAIEAFNNRERRFGKRELSA